MIEKWLATRFNVIKKHTEHSIHDQPTSYTSNRKQMKINPFTCSLDDQYDIYCIYMSNVSLKLTS